MNPEDIADEFRSAPKAYTRPAPLDGVRVLRLDPITDDRGFFFELFRDRSDHAHGAALAEFFRGIRVAQMNFSTVDAEGHIKGLHYHLRQEDIWFFPPPSKAKVVLYDVRTSSPTFRATQTLVTGGGQNLLIRIPSGIAHGYRPLTNPCSLLYIVTETFDPSSPDEFRIPWDHPDVRELWQIPNG